ncbi:MAG: aminotransferase class III-fold pyridoxal phosphate-dependent enzyme, partial [Actinomycetes bacterium]
MTATDLLSGSPNALQDAAKNHLWMYFTRHGNFATQDVPMIVRGEGCYVYTDKGKRIIDGLAGLFTVQIGHGRKELGEAAKEQSDKLAFFPLWSYAHPMAAALAERLAKLAPGDLNKVFFTSGGGEAVETAWKLIKNYYKLIGKPTKHKIISRALSYHGTSQGALSITGIPFAKIPFEPLVPGGHKVPNTNFYRAPQHVNHDEKEFGIWAADQI